MALFRRKTLFHVEEALPDPEELKLRFRRRVLLLTFFGFVLVLAIPVTRELRPVLEGRWEARKFAETILQTRILAASSRMPVALELDSSGKGWKRIFHSSGEDCTHPAEVPVQNWTTEVSWKIQIQKEAGESFGGRVLCLHPTLGILLDSVPLENGKLLITASRDGQDKPAYLLLGSYGADIDLLSH